MRKALIAVLAVVLLGMVLYAANRYQDRYDHDLPDYYLSNFTEDTGARNAVAAIYLNYRVYDTLFEALILLAAVTAMLRFFELGGKR